MNIMFHGKNNRTECNHIDKEKKIIVKFNNEQESLLFIIKIIYCLI